MLIDVTTAGLKADLSGSWFDGVCGGTSFSSAGYGFTVADVGKAIAVTNGGITQVTNILSVASGVATIAPLPAGSSLTFLVGTDNTAALNSLLSSAGAFYFPGGNYLFAGIVKVTKHGCRLVGDSRATTKLFYVNSGAFPFIDIQSAQQTNVNDMTLWITAPDYAGYVVQVRNSGAGDPAQTSFTRVSLSLQPNANGFLLDTSLENLLTDVRISGGFTGIQGAIGPSPGSYSNVFKMIGGQFTGYGNACVRGAGEAWSFEGVTFEGRSDGRMLVFQGLSNAPITNLAFRDCWIGDTLAAGRNAFTVFGRGFTAHNNLIAGGGGSDSCFVLNNLIGFDIRGNAIKGFASAINYAGPANGGMMQCNAYNLVTGPFEANLPNKGPWVTTGPNIQDPTL